MHIIDKLVMTGTLRNCVSKRKVFLRCAWGEAATHLRVIHLIHAFVCVNACALTLAASVAHYRAPSDTNESSFQIGNRLLGFEAETSLTQSDPLSLGHLGFGSARPDQQNVI